MAVYIQSSVSHSSCGNSATEKLEFSAQANTTLPVDNQQSVQFYAMRGLKIDTSEQRLLGSLSVVIEKLIEDNKLTAEDLARTALLLGSTSLDIGTLTSVPNSTIWLPKIDRLSRTLQQKYGLNAFHLTFNTACTASLNALLYSKKLIEKANFKYVIVLGCEFYNHLTVEGFHSLDLLSDTQIKPFLPQRDGLILGEGIGALLIANSKPEREYCYQLLEGYSGCDTSSLTMTAEDGSHIETVLTNAVASSKLKSSDIDLVKVHATATFNNDIAEYNGLVRYFKTAPDLFALKPFIGHTLGSCGAVEIALMDYLLSYDQIPIPECISNTADELMLPFAASNRPLRSYQHILINHCGFGGNNAALVLRTIQQ